MNKKAKLQTSAEKPKRKYGKRSDYWKLKSQPVMRRNTTVKSELLNLIKKHSETDCIMIKLLIDRFVK